MSLFLLGYSINGTGTGLSVCKKTNFACGKSCLQEVMLPRSYAPSKLHVCCHEIMFAQDAMIPGSFAPRKLCSQEAMPPGGCAPRRLCCHEIMFAQDAMIKGNFAPRKLCTRNLYSWEPIQQILKLTESVFNTAIETRSAKWKAVGMAFQ